MLPGADSALLLGLFGLLALGIVAHYLFCTQYNELIALYLITAWLEFYLDGAVWLLFGTDRMADPYVLSIVAGLLIVYLLCFVLYGGVLTRYYGLIARTALRIPRWVIVCAFIVWLGFKAFLVRKYGLIVFGSLKLRELSGEPHSMVDIDALLLMPAMGAYVAYTIQVAQRGRKAFSFLIAGLWVAFVVVNVLAEQSGGGKRMMILTALTAFLMLPEKRFQLSARLVAAGFAAVLAIAVFSNRYQAVRQNFFALRNDMSHLAVGRALTTIFEPSQHYTTLSQDIENRSSPIDLLYQITKRQLNGKGVAGGLLIRQAFLNSVPGILFKKKVVDDDYVTASFFNMLHVDYPTTPLEEIQTECFLPAYIIVPAIYVALLWMFLALLERYQERSWLFSLALMGILIQTAGSVETGLTALVVAVRNVMLLWALSEALFQIVRLRLLPSTAPLAEQEGIASDY